MKKMCGAEVVVEVLKAEGVEHVFGYPGVSNMEILDQLYHTPTIKYILVRHEQAAAFMANGYARATGKPGVVLTTSGPGAMNIICGVGTAYTDSTPIVAITGQVPLANINKNAIEEADLVNLFRPITKWSVEVHRVESLAETLRNGFKIATTGRKGPVNITIPRDLLAMETITEVTSSTQGMTPVVEPDLELIQRGCELLVESKRPAILVGGGVSWSGAASYVMNLAESISAPVVTSWHRHIVPMEHPLSLGVLGLGGTKPANQMISKVDVLLAIGCKFCQGTTGNYNLISNTTKIIQVDIDPYEIGRNYPVEVAIVADAASTLRKLIEAVKTRSGAAPKERSTWMREIQNLKEKWEREITRSSNNEEKPIKPARLVKSLRNVLNRNAILVCDSGGCQSWLSQRFKTYKGGMFVSSAFGSMGFGFTAALGVKIAHPNRQVVAIVGDGGFMMTAQELETAIRYNINTVTVIWNNFSLGLIKFRQLRDYSGRYIGVDFQNPDFVKMAEAFGAYGERVEEPAEIELALVRALKAKKPALLDVIMDPDPSLASPPS